MTQQLTDSVKYPKLILRPISIRNACLFINKYHRHHIAPQGAKFAVSVESEEEIAGVATAGRPVARYLDDGYTIEITRVCTKNGFKNAASMLYAATWRAARAMGYKRAISYVLKKEKGTSLKAAGYKLIGEAGGGTWNRPSRNRQDKHPVEEKTLWRVE